MFLGVIPLLLLISSNASIAETVKDLIKFLKREDESCDIRRQLGEAQIFQKDLIPIVKQYHEDRILLETLIR